VTRRSVHAIRLGLLMLGLAAAAFVVLAVGPPSSKEVRGWVSGYGAAGPLVFIFVAAGLSTVLVPGPLLAGAAGLLFGTAEGFPTALVGAVLGACLCCTIGRGVGRRSLEELAGPRVREIKERIEARGFLAILYGRIIPGVPYTLVSYAAGLTRIPLRVFAPATALGAAPRTFAYVALGGSLNNLGSPAAIVSVVVLVVMAVAGIVIARREGIGRRRRPGAAAVSAAPPSPPG
jgi:uncharacterized membrane protein YdjX (TVP38/TMEM64 family)